jgi:hypothetical protein
VQLNQNSGEKEKGRLDGSEFYLIILNLSAEIKGWKIDDILQGATTLFKLKIRSACGVSESLFFSNYH